ncbi:hypothetical protein [Paractinoplanes maris]|uniref:hypothetical protein n=1 Tax=Paractinoplanes maris TaxID=1734446 RepID=UPI00202279D6|nr:hypothetical protein [Actinoplanes maris]
MNDLEIARAEALFCSDLQPSHTPSGDQVRDAVAYGLDWRGPQALAVRMAEEFGDHQEESARRMRWCRRAVRAAFDTVDA